PAQAEIPQAAKPQAPPPPPKGPASAPEQRRVQASQPPRSAPQAAEPEEAAEEEETVSADGKRIRSSPLVRRLARENGIDLGKLNGTGAGGRISKRDVLAAISAGQQPVASASQAGKPSGAPGAETAPAHAALEA